MSRHTFPAIPAAKSQAEPLFRIWIAQVHDRRPTDPHAVPPGATAVEPAEPQCMTTVAAADYVGSFNRAQLERADNRWAVAVPVTVRYEGEPAPGEAITGVALSPVE